MLHASISERYVRERTLYVRLLRACFAAAGLFWFLLYALPTTTHVELRGGQTIIYFVLLTLWGLDYMREQKRLGVIIAAANGRNVRPDAITIDDVADRIALFSMLTPRGGVLTAIIPIVFTVGLFVAWILVIAQYVRALSILAH